MYKTNITKVFNQAVCKKNRNYFLSENELYQFCYKRLGNHVDARRVTDLVLAA